MNWSKTLGVFLLFPSTAFSWVNCVPNPFQIGCSPIPAPMYNSQTNATQKDINKLLQQQNKVYGFMSDLEAFKDANFKDIPFLAKMFEGHIPLQPFPIVEASLNNLNVDSFVGENNQFSNLGLDISHSAIAFSKVSLQRSGKLASDFEVDQTSVQNLASLKKIRAKNEAVLTEQTLLNLEQSFLRTDIDFAISGNNLYPIRQDTYREITYTPYEGKNPDFMELYRKVINFSEFSNDYLSYERYNILNPTLQEIIDYHDSLLNTKVQLTSWFVSEVGKYLDENEGETFLSTLLKADQTKYEDNVKRRDVAYDVIIAEMANLLIKMKAAYPPIEKVDNEGDKYFDDQDIVKLFYELKFSHPWYYDTRYVDLKVEQIEYPSTPISVGIKTSDGVSSAASAYFPIARNGFAFLETHKLEQWWLPFRTSSEERLERNVKIQNEIQEKWNKRITEEELVIFRKHIMNEIESFAYKDDFPIVYEWLAIISTTENKLDYLTINLRGEQ